MRGAGGRLRKTRLAKARDKDKESGRRKKVMMMVESGGGRRGGACNYFLTTNIY